MLQPKFGSHGEYQIIALVPSSPQEMFDFTITAFNKAEKYRVPVFILADALVGHMRERVDFPFKDEIVLDERKKLETYQGIHQKIFLDEDVAPMPIFGKGLKANITGSTHKEDGFRNVSDPKIMDTAIRKLSNKILKHKEDIIAVEEKYLEDAEVAIFSYGLVYRAVLETVNTARSQGLKVGSFRPITIWPFPQEQVEELSKKLKTIIVCENNLGQIYPFVKAAANGNAKVVFLPPKILGALYKQEEILNKIKEVIS